jgi:ATP-binding protein involved in chromosome partitioning
MVAILSNPYRMGGVSGKGGVRIQQRGGPLAPPPQPGIKVSENLKSVRNILAVLSGKGGVGKSFVTASLAVALSKFGRRVGVLDMDFHGPSMPIMLGVKQELLAVVEKTPGTPRIEPAEGYGGVKVVSIDLMLSDKTTPVVWRGAIKVRVLQQLLEDVEWGDLDYLLIDMPPGTGDDALNLVQTVPRIEGLIFVTLPSEVSSHVVAKSIRFVEMTRESLGKDIPIIGVIENMSYFICEHGKEYYIFGKGGGDKLSKALGTKILGKIPLDPRIAESNDKGISILDQYPDSPASKEIVKIAHEIENIIKISK